MGRKAETLLTRIARHTGHTGDSLTEFLAEDAEVQLPENAGDRTERPEPTAPGGER